MNYPETIFVVDEHDLPEKSAIPRPGDDTPYKPNFTFPVPTSGDRSGKVAEVITLAKASDLSPLVVRALSAASVGLAFTGPISFVLFAATAGVSAISAVVEGKDAASKEAAKQRLEEQLQEFQRYLELHAVSPKGARDREFVFAPGHPRIGMRYRLHPLANVPSAGRERLYIPEESFDQTLLDERESELLKLLVELGATRISISERSTKTSSSLLEAGASASVAGAGEASASGKQKSAASEDGLDSREFELVGRAVDATQKIDATKFAWLPFEPSWKSLVSAREVGQCTRAVLVLKEETAYSNEAQLSMELKLASIGGGGAKAAKALDELSSRTYVFQVDFAPFRTSASEAAQVGQRV